MGEAETVGKKGVVRNGFLREARQRWGWKKRTFILRLLQRVLGCRKCILFILNTEKTLSKILQRKLVNKSIVFCFVLNQRMLLHILYLEKNQEKWIFLLHLKICDHKPLDIWNRFYSIWHKKCLTQDFSSPLCILPWTNSLQNIEPDR